ncbi:MAG TPA: hypothetical protein VLJ17_24750 [Xanthobacteraceae bacterium]|nr:hypothetical protein [Xanthobacteraceae bacterium]
MTYQLPIGSYSMLNTADICLWQMFRRYIVKDIPFVESKEVKHGNKTHTAFEHRLGSKKKPLPPDMQQWEKWCAPLDPYSPEVEQWFGLRRDGLPTASRNADCYFRGKVDCFIFDPKTFRSAMIFDWKTGKVREQPFELETSALFIKAKYPQLEKITGRYVWLKDDRMGQPYDLSNARSTWDTVHHKMTDIERRLMQGPQAFEKMPGPLCGWCSVFDCEHNTNPNRGEQK